MLNFKISIQDLESASILHCGLTGKTPFTTFGSGILMISGPQVIILETKAYNHANIFSAFDISGLTPDLAQTLA